MTNELVKIDSSTLDGRFLNIPIIKNNADNLKMRKDSASGSVGAYVMWLFIALAVFYGAVYFLPAFFTILGKLAGLAVCGVFGLGILYNLENIHMFFKRFSKAVKNVFINSDPFFYLGEGIKKAENNLALFRQSKQSLLGVFNSLSRMALDTQQEAKNLFTDIENKTTLVNRYKTKLEKGDNSAENQVALQRAINDVANIDLVYKQKVNFAERYALKASTYKKVYQRFLLLEPKIENEVQQLKISVRMLEDEFKALAMMKTATETAKSALGFTKDEDVELAMRIVNDTIAYNTAVVTSDLTELSKFTEDYVMNNDEALEKFDKISKNLDSKFTLDVSKYDANYKPTEREKVLEPLSSIF